MDATTVQTSPPPREPHKRTELRAFYSLVLVLALYGQSTGASSWLIPTGAGRVRTLALVLLVVAFVLVLELGAVVLLRRAEQQRRAGQKAAVAILAAIAIALGAAGLSWAGHWGTGIADQIQAYAFAGATLLGVLVWAIMSDLSMDPTVARHRSVAGAVRRYVKDLKMDDSEKAVLLATMDVPMITRLITGGPDAFDAADGRDRNVRIARILATAIDPSTWHASAEPKSVRPATIAPSTPKPDRKPSAPVKKQPRPSGDFTAIERAFVDLYVRTGERPSGRAIEDAVRGTEGARKKTAICDWMKDNPKTIAELIAQAEDIRAQRATTVGVPA